MLLKDAIITATVGIRTNTSRSALTILGIVIGIASIILIASVGGRSSFLRTVSSTTDLVNISKISSKGVDVCKATGRPESPDSLMLCTKGISPKKRIFKSSAKFLSPSFPMI